MLKIQVSSPSPDPPLSSAPSLADLSRNASVISSGSSSSSTSDVTVLTPARPRPLRTFSSPRTNVRSRSPQSPTTPRGSRPPAYLTRELGMGSDDDEPPSQLRATSRPPGSRAQSKSRSSSVNGRNPADDYEFGRVLGEGSYSTVRLAKHRVTGHEYAIKILDKGHLRRYNKMATALAEKNTLVRLGSGHPGIVRLHQAFQDEWSLCFVLDLARNGELQSRISRMGSLSTECARVYAAQIADALQYMHSKGVIHRDLKPENLLLDDAFRIKITDFGTGKITDSSGERTKTFVGTAQYVSPELLEDSETSESSDFWALGCILYQMISGRFAFQGPSDYLTWQKVKQLEYTFPEGFDEQARDLVTKLLVRDPSRRLGAGPPGSEWDTQALRSHPFLSPISWKTLWTDAMPPLEPGLFKKDTPQKSPWDDVGEQWDELVGDDDDEEDNISWASDAEGNGYAFPTQNAVGANGHTSGIVEAGEEIGPKDERRPLAFSSPPLQTASQPRRDSSNIPSDALSVRFAGVPESGSAVVDDESRPGSSPGAHAADSEAVPGLVKAQPIDVPAVPLTETYSTGSATSSSDGSPVDRLEAMEEAAARGRNRAQTPIQGNGLADSEWTSILLPSESVEFNTVVEPSAPKRRASRLLAMAVGPQRKKTRELVLTTRRLLCLKRKPGRGILVRLELHLHPHERDPRQTNVVTGVEAKGDREFVIMTATKSHCFIATSPELASAWIRKICGALEAGQSSSTTPKGARSCSRT